MKKTLCLFLAMLFLLTSCNNAATDTRSPKDTDAFYLDSLPDIGKFSGKIGEARFYDEPTYDFVPSGAYGRIIPYVGSYRVFETPKREDSSWHTPIGYAAYGFCTPDGKIVMDASDKNTYINYRETDDGFGFYTVTRETSPKDDAPDEFLPSETYVIPLDGTWCLKLEGSSWVTNAGGGYVSVCDYTDDGGVRIKLYDYDGKLVRTIEGVDSTGMFSQGLMLVSSWGKGGYSAEFINESGEKVLGPYSAASDFNEYGITAVEDEKGAYLINTKGEILSDFYESFFKEFSDDMNELVYVGRHGSEPEVSDVFSADGKLLGSVSGATYMSFKFPDNGDIYYYYTIFDNNDKGHAVYNSEKMIFKRLGDNMDFVSKEFGVSPNAYSGTDNCFVHIDKAKKVGYLFDCNGETIAVLDGASDVINTSEYGEYAIYIEGEYEYSFDEETGKPKPDTRKTHVYDSKKKEIVFTLDSSSNAHFADKDKRFIVLSEYDVNDMFGSIEASWLLDTNTGEIVFENCKNITFYTVGDNTYINVCTDNSSALYDENMKLIRRNYYE